MQRATLAMFARILPGREGWKLIATGLLVASVLLHLQAFNLSSRLLDFGSFWESGRAASEGVDPYAVYPLTHTPISPPNANPNLNPPTSLLFLAPLARFDPYTGQHLIRWTSLAVYVFILVLLVRRYRPSDSPLIVAWAVALPAFWNSLSLGQVYILLLAPLAAGWFLIERGKPLAGGLAIGVASAFKPNLLVWPALLFFAGHRREAFAAVAAFSAVSTAPLIFWGPEVYLQWFELILNDDPVRRAHFANASLAGMAARLGIPLAGIFAAGALLVAAAVLVHRRRPEAPQIGMFAITLSILASPLAWFHYILFLVPAIFAVREWRVSLIAACAMMAIPLGIVGWSGLELAKGLPGAEWISAVTMKSFYTWVAVLLAVGAMRDLRPPEAESAAGKRRATGQKYGRTLTSSVGKATAAD